MNSKRLLLAYYGDDFTGSTDALEFLSRAGAKTLLFIQPPTADQLQKYNGLQAVGVAGMSRSMTPPMMEEELIPAFTSLKKLGALHVHYKICSTFDSSPTIGCIGKAIDIGAAIFQSKFIPLLVAAPALGRYCTFGNLFARMGIGSSGSIYRLDRHPSMTKHPVTPSNESDLRLHLSHQTSREIGLLDILHIMHPDANEKLKEIIEHGADVVLFDALYEEQMSRVGKLLDAYATDDKMLFSVGSSGIEMALGDYWIQKKYLQPTITWKQPERVTPLLAISGSCSPVTSNQITWAVNNGFADVPLDTKAILHGESDAVIHQCVSMLVGFLRQERNVILHTSCGPNDPRVSETKDFFAKKGLELSMISLQTASLYGSAMGRIIKLVMGQVPLKRLLIAGGDTSGYVAKEMGIESMEMIAPLAPGAPLCKVHAPGSPIDGLEINFKGGQVGSENYFELVLEGKYSL